ncbi:hypothetical protein CKA32_003503 [Geitlerinema sp. FC II]|nr:hypothetical protein CKA32_003503 [Geitlerinema sp. FC II]
MDERLVNLSSIKPRSPWRQLRSPPQNRGFLSLSRGAWGVFLSQDGRQGAIAPATIDIEKTNGIIDRAAMSAPLITQEVRWFLDGELPQSVKRWFFKDCPGNWLSCGDSRTDVYLMVPESEAINIKRRHGDSLELKWRESALGVWPVGDDAGRVERWSKWVEEPIISPQFSDRWWIDTHKTRWQRQYRDVRYELTQLQTPYRLSWSLAYELDLPHPNARSRLIEILNETLTSYPDGNLSPSHSYSYTHWLLFSHQSPVTSHQ